MAIIKCKMCGGDVELAADKTFGTCEFCGNTMTFPKVDDDQRAAAFNRGNHFRRIGEFDKALAVYERIVREDDTDAEAHWCCALCRFGIEYVEDPATYEWLPTCHRASFDSFLEDVDYLAAVENSDGITKRQYQKDAAKIAEVQRGILATSQNAEPYDVFICYKESDANGDRTRDSLLAQDIYYQLTEQGRKVFFARITLEDVVGSQYEPYIFAALNSAKVMIVVGTQPEYLNAVWVKNEWSRFLALMKKDRSKLLLPCYRDMDPYDLPEQLSVLQSYDMSKIGFIQDLIRGISKVLDAEKKPEPVHETVTIQQTNSNVVALIKRGNMALEDGEWDKADQFFEEVLNQDAECVDAYLGKTLAGLHLQHIGLLAESPQAFFHNLHFQKALRFSKGAQLQTLKDYRQKSQEFLLERGKAILESGQWDVADRFFDQALVNDPECVEAYIGKLLAQLELTNAEQLSQTLKAYSQDPNYQKALQFAKEEELQRLKKHVLQQQAFLLEEANRKLQEGGWKAVVSMMTTALVNDEDCAEAYIARFLARYGFSSLEKMVEKKLEFTPEVSYQQVKVPAELLQSYQSHIDEMAQKYVVDGEYLEDQIRECYRFETVPCETYANSWKRYLQNQKSLLEQSEDLKCAMKLGQSNDIQKLTAAMEELLRGLQQRVAEAEEADRVSSSNVTQWVEKAVSNADEKVRKDYVDAVARLCRRMTGVLNRAKNAGEVSQILGKIRPHSAQMPVQTLLQRCEDRLTGFCRDHYNYACDMMVKAKTEAEYRAVKRLFVEIADYKDSMERAQKCRELELRLQSSKIQATDHRRDLLIQEQQELEAELEGLSKLFGGKRRREIETRLEEISRLLS